MIILINIKQIISLKLPLGHSFFIRNALENVISNHSLNVTFKFVQSLAVLWQEFIAKNQGFTQYCHARQLINAIVSNTEQSIDADNWQVQAYINQQLSSMFRLYDGITFTADTDFPTSTQAIHQLVLQHIQNFDSRF